MPNVIFVKDKTNLVSTSKFKLAKFKFDQFNPVQSRFFEFYDQDVNTLVTSKTGSGKTTIAEMAISYENTIRGGKALYVAPQKSLSQEKIDSWTDDRHSFSKRKLSICTGDYRLTADRRKELEYSDIILMTFEMLNSKIRNNIDNNSWIKDIGVCVIDEFHYAGSQNRGDKLEVGIIKTMQVNPHCRFIGLSATIPNAAELAEWVAKITDRDTVVIESDYRPCPLEVHYVTYDDSIWKYKEKEKEKIAAAMDIISRHPEDKFIVFAHTKDTGRMMKQALLLQGIKTEFHNADLDKAKRIALERRFKEDSGLRVIVATSTLAVGINMPARRVIILGVHRGLSEVEVVDLHQAVGRSGRPGFDNQGDAYLLLPKKDQSKHILRFENPPPIQSQLVAFGSDDHRILAFHIVSEIYQGSIKNVDDIYHWYNKTLSSHQRRHLDQYLVEDMIQKLISRNIIRNNDGDLTVTPLGKISSLFFYSPYDVADLKQNMDSLFCNNQEYNELWIATALAKVDSNRHGIVSASEIEQMGVFPNKLDYKLRDAFGQLKGFSQYVVKMTYCYYLILNGINNETFGGTVKGIRSDIDRLLEVLHAIDSMSGKWGKSDYIDVLSKKISHGVQWDLLNLCAIKGIGRAKAMKLWQAGLKSAKDLIAKPKLTQSVLRCSDSVIQKTIEAAKLVDSK